MFINNAQDIFIGGKDLVYYLELVFNIVLLLPFSVLALAFPFMTKIIIKTDGIEYHTLYYVLHADWKNLGIGFAQGSITGRTLVVIPQRYTLILRSWVKPFRKIFKNQIQNINVLVSQFGKSNGHSLDIDIQENMSKPARMGTI